MSICGYLLYFYGILDFFFKKKNNIKVKTARVGVLVHETLENCYLIHTGKAMGADGGRGVGS